MAASIDKMLAVAYEEVGYLEKDWFLILNDTSAAKLMVLKVPANRLSLTSGKGFFIRSDKGAIDLKLKGDELTDRNSGIDFTQFIIESIDY